MSEILAHLLSDMQPIHLHYLNAPDIEALAMTDQEILDAVEAGLRAQGLGQTVIEPRMHLVPDKSIAGHFNVLRGFIQPLAMAGVKVVGDFYENYQTGLPSELAMLYLADPKNGAPIAMIDASAITDMRTGAVTALGAKYLARKNSKVLGHIGARGTAYWNVRLLNHLFELKQIRVHSRRPESRNAFGAQLERDLGRKIVVTESIFSMDGDGPDLHQLKVSVDRAGAFLILDEAHAAFCVEDEESCFQKVEFFLNHPEASVEAGRCASDAVSRYRGASALQARRVMECLAINLK